MSQTTQIYDGAINYGPYNFESSIVTNKHNCRVTLFFKGSRAKIDESNICRVEYAPYEAARFADVNELSASCTQQALERKKTLLVTGTAVVL